MKAELVKERKYFASLGNVSLLGRPNRFALFCSNRCPGEIIIKCQDWANGLIGSNALIISGFHTLVEKDVLRILLRGNHPVAICPARSLTKMRLPVAWKEGIEEGTVCLVSDFPPSITRATKETAEQRNYFVANLSNSVLIPYAAPGSKTESLAKNLLKGGVFVFTFDSPHTQNLKALGCKLLQVGE
jgi:predicted Rossmann fold nucleotide-binding protein DprA/Smf involved in DNA uptake